MRYFLSSLFLVFFLVELCAQKHIAHTQKFTLEDGLSSYNITKVFQCKSGFIWIATDYGLNRYDGREFKVYTKENSGLCHNRIKKIEEDVNGNFWIEAGAYGGRKCQSIFNPQTEIFCSWDEYLEDLGFDSDELGISGNYKDVLVLRRINPNQLDSSYYYYEYRGHKIHKIFNLYRSIKEGSVPYGTIKLEANKYATLYSFKKDLVNGKYVQITDSLGQPLYKIKCPENLSVRPPISLKKEEFCLKCNTTNDQEYLFAFLVNEQATGVAKLAKIQKEKGFLIKTLYKNEKLYAIRKRAVDVYALNGELLQHVELDVELQIGLDENPFIDQHGDLWVGSYQCLYHISLQKKIFDVSLSSSKKARHFRGIEELPNGNVLACGTTFWTVINPDTGLVYLQNNAGDLADVVATTQGILITSEKRGVQRFDSLQPFEPYTVYNEQTRFLFWTLQEDANKQIWVGGAIGLYFIAQDKSLVPFEGYGVYKKLKTSAIYHFYKNREGTWLATSSGLYLMNLEEGQILEHYSSEQEGENYIPTAHIAHIAEDVEGVFWLATKGDSLVKWNPKTKAYRQFDQIQSGLSHNVLYAVYEDDFDNLWIPSNRGLMRFNKKTEAINIFLVEDGLPDNEFNTISHFRASDGRLYFGTQNGLIYFHPNEIETTSITYPFVITEFSKQDNRTDSISYLTNELKKKHTIYLYPNDKSFNLKFALLGYYNAKDNQYSYRIEGYDKGWTYQSENAIKINALPYGNYVLKIRAKPALNGSWVDYDHDILIYVVKPFYLQTWFLLMSSLLGALVIFMGFRWRLQRVEKQKEVLEEIVKQRTAKIEEDKKLIEQQAEDLKVVDRLKSRFFANISHELRTPLTLILGPLSYVLDNPAKLEEVQVIQKLRTMERNGKNLLRLIEEMLDLSKLEANKLELHEEVTFIQIFLTTIYDSFKPQADYQNIHFTFENLIEEDLGMMLDRNKTEKIINNLLSNALKFTPAKGKVILKVLISEGRFLLEVKDTGKGIPEEDLNSIFERFFQAGTKEQRPEGGTGIGLALSHELAELMEGNLSVESKVGLGSTFRLELPINEVEIALLDEDGEEEDVEVQIEESFIVPQNANQYTILLVEDNNDMRNYVGSLLLPYYHLLTAANGLEGLKLLEDNTTKINLIISDVMMPEMDGFEMLKVIKDNKSWRNIPIMMLTARASEQDKLHALTVGVDDYLTKPFSIAELLVRAKKLIDNYYQRLEWKREEKEEPNKTESEKTELNISDADKVWALELETYIKKDIFKTYNNADLAKHFFISQRQFERRLKKVTGLTPAKFVKEIRLQIAREILEKGNASAVKEVAYSSGFKTAKNFSTSYVKRFGKSPSEYLKK
ncbi:MAG: response regulator [Aureispira sp.]|nr:response regulator [Aureispira sp.]